MEAFETGIGAHRDVKQCVICGEPDRVALQYTHIIPKVETDTVRDALLF